jgi:acyl-CoA hydrolase
VPELRAKTVADSRVTLVDQMQVTDANLMGNVHGGVIMRMVDNAAGLAAIKHSEGPVVTAAMDEMSFLEPVFVGDVVTVKASVNEAFTTSVEVGVRVEAEDIKTGEVKHTSSAYLVFVALDERGRPRKVPPLVAESERERQRQTEAKLRREARLARKEAIERARGTEGEPT